ncbi:hypothetical protein [Pseudomonas quasicaspiana]|nr:hypothetical protein [Pseudomonas quasicaspiana]
MNVLSCALAAAQFAPRMGVDSLIKMTARSGEAKTLQVHVH